MATVRIPQSSLFNNSLMLFVSFLLVTIPLINGFSVLVSKTHPSTVFLADCKNRGNASYRARWTTKTTTLLAKDDTESSSGEKSYFATAVVTELSNDSPNTVEGSSKALQVVTVDDDDDDDDANPYLKIGIEPEQLALGVKANEFLKYIGT